uniref:Bacterioferritin n=1 Tax=Paulinella chromatophora TaxID=39717 RepID=A6YIN5_PAUCH|nr:bacterioferritin [Paulinella chromatophora]ABS00407.1 bacterioferritin [Paulinella chromatophora]ACB43323.1 bacterioferritin [Paulinella chromatophora]|eukprot:gb/GEZN01004111.1/.p2 GENE.gb/GEZN01004111.1/~~gb/GEZN01004111.1/.p2  ORF type:complete len:158 (+),score=8.58 gb/GEZN01004111.1/:1326-1799(+)
MINALHPRILGYLGRALSLELSAVQQYMTQASLVALWGEQEAAQRFRNETVEEMQHAEKIVKRMLESGVVPSASQLRPVSIASDLVGLLKQNIDFEADLISHYSEAVLFCRSIGDQSNIDFFQDLFNDEKQHGTELSQWLHELKPSQPQTSIQRASF